MITDDLPPVVQKIPVNQITVLNPRARNQKIFREIVDSISKVGLKKPITVNKRTHAGGKKPYQLVCGQGRLEAFVTLGESEIPAIVVDVSEKESLLMSLVENLARRQHRPLELLREIGDLGDRGYSSAEIARKTGLSYDYVHAIRRLLKDGEERLLTAVENGQIPVSIATEIAETDEDGAQDALTRAYQDGRLRGKKLLIAKRLVDQRKKGGKGLVKASGVAPGNRLSSDALVRAYEREASRQRLLIKKAELAHNRLLFIVEAIRRLLSDDNFVTLLRAENLETMPRAIAELVDERGAE